MSFLKAQVHPFSCKKSVSPAELLTELFRASKNPDDSPSFPALFLPFLCLVDSEQHGDAAAWQRTSPHSITSSSDHPAPCELLRQALL